MPLCIPILTPVTEQPDTAADLTVNFYYLLMPAPCVHIPLRYKQFSSPDQCQVRSYRSLSSRRDH